MAKTYAEKLKDPRWQKKRLEVLNHYDFLCQICGDGESTLHVHHKQYIKGREVWDYDKEQLVCLCENCHENQHELDANFNDLIARLQLNGPGSKDEAYYLLAGFIGHQVPMTYDYEKRLYDIGSEAQNYWRSSK